MTSQEWIIGISVAIVALAFLALVIYLIRTLIAVKNSLEETEKLLFESRVLIVDVETKLKALNPLFHLVEHLGETKKKDLGATIHHLSDEVHESIREEKEQLIQRTTRTIMDVLEWGLVGVTLWKKFKGRK